jgi:hypothetical protein
MAQIRIGGSSAERILRCPGSVPLCAAAPASKTEEAAWTSEGTLAHKLGETCLLNALEPSEMVGRFVAGVEIEPELAEAVTIYTDFVRSFIMDEKGQLDLDAKANLHLEARVNLHWIDPACEGTTDAYLFLQDKGELHVFDYKHGAGVNVEAAGNRQLQFYALAAMGAIPKGVDRVFVHVVQPNCDNPEGPIRTAEIDILDLIAFGSELKQAIDLSRTPNAPLAPGKHCQFCEAASFCPALFKLSRAALDMEVEDARIADIGGTLEPDEVGRRLSMVEPLRHWITGITQFAWGEAKRGRVPTGYKLVRVKGRRRWKGAVDDAMQGAATQFSIEEAKFFKKRWVSPRQFEKLVGEKRARDFLATYAEMNDRAVSLVPATDKREAVEPDAHLDFADLQESTQ